MKNCEQTKGQSVLDHGISVKNYLFDLINHLRTGDPLKYNWILPDWIYTNKDLILSSLPDDNNKTQSWKVIYKNKKDYVYKKLSKL